MSMNSTPHWKMYAALSLGFILLTTAIVFISQPWVITAVPIGFLFGFFMQKGDLCGASAFSEVLLEKEIERVKELEDLAREVVRSGEDGERALLESEMSACVGEYLLELPHPLWSPRQSARFAPT